MTSDRKQVRFHHLFEFIHFNCQYWMPDETDAKKVLTASSLGELDETTRTPSYYVDEDYPVRPEIQ